MNQYEETERVDLIALRRLARRAPWIVKQDSDQPLILAAADEIERLRALAKVAPHGYDCASGTMMNVEEFFPCDCWKARA